MKTGLKRRAAALAMAAALMLALIPTVLPMEAKASVVVDIAVEKLVAMSETGLSKIIAGADHACGDDKVSSFVNTWFFEDAGTAQTVERIEELCEEILDRLDELEDQISRETSQIEKMIAEATASAALNNLNNAWKTQVEDQIPTDIADAVEAYQAYFRAARQYGINPIQANRDRKDAAREELRDALVDVYQAETNSYNANATDLDPAMKTTAADSRFDDCMKDLIRQLNTGTYNVTDYAAMAAYQCLVFADDQYAFIDSYMQKQLLTAGWVLLTYNELMAMQSAYIEENYSGSDEYGQLMTNYQAAEQDLSSACTSLLDEATTLMDRELTFSPVESVKLRLIQLMKPEDNLIVNLRNNNYHDSFPMDMLMKEDSVDNTVKNYMRNNSDHVWDPDNLAVWSPEAADFELVGVTTRTGTEFYYILQQTFLLQQLEYKFNISDGDLYSPDVHSPSCDWYNLRDWAFDFAVSKEAADVTALFGQTTALALNGNTARYALGAEHSPYSGSQTMYIFTPDYKLDYSAVTSYADITFLEADEEVSGESVPSTSLSADSMQAGDGKKQNDVAIYIVKRTDTSRTISAVTQGDCVLQVDVEQEKGRTPNYRDSISQPFGRYLSIRCRANGDEVLSHLYVKRYLTEDKSKYTLEVIADSEIFRILTPEDDGFYYLTFPMPACEADILLTTATEDTDGGVTAAGFQQQKERLTALQKDTAVRTADVIVGSVSNDSVAPLTELLRTDPDGTRIALRQLVDETDTIYDEKASYDSALSSQTNSRVSEAYTKLDGAWRYRVTEYTDPFSDAAGAFLDYVDCLAYGTDPSAAEAVYLQKLNALSATGDFRSDSSINVSLEKALAKLIYYCTLTDETKLDPFGSTDPYHEYLETRVASVTVQAARAAYEMYPLVNDQRDMIDTYLDAQINEIAWLLLMYQDIVSRQDPDFAKCESYPAHVSRLAQSFLAGLETAVDTEMTFWADKDSNKVIALKLSAYPTGADVYDGSAPLEYRFTDPGYESSMGVNEWDSMRYKGYEMHFEEDDDSSCPADQIAGCNSFYLLPVLGGHSAASVNPASDLLFFHVLSGTHALKTLEYKQNIKHWSDYHVPSTDYFNLMAQGYGDESKGSSITETSLAALAGTQAFVNNGKSLRDLLSPFVSTDKALYLLVTPSLNNNPKIKWDTRGTYYAELPMVDADGKDISYSYISAEHFQAGEKMQDDQYAFLRKAEPGAVTVTGSVSNPGRNGEAVIGVALSSVGYDPLNDAIWQDSLTVDPGTSIHLRIKPGDGVTVTSLSVQRYTKEDETGTVTSTELIADTDDFRYLEKDNAGYYHIEVTVPYAWVSVNFIAETSYSSGGRNGTGSGSGISNIPTANPISTGTAEGGSVKLSPSNAKAGDTVTFTTTPDAGYQVKKINVVDKNGNLIPVTKNADGTYSFTMPATSVTVTPVFEKIADQPTGGDVCDIFKDVSEDAWYHDAVQWAVDKGIMNGVAPDLFAPDATCTRAMVVTMLWRLEGEPVVNYLLPYTDVSAEQWYTEAVRWAASAGAVTGMSADTFAPDAEITREQLATILYRYAQAQGKGFTGAWAFPLDYPDAADVSDYAYEALCWMTMNGVIQGMDDGTLAPGANATRAQIAAMFQRFDEAMAK